ncbi:4-aminobutyrate aminotransferase / (S)-3-amino-2-methylpropionate transaminase [Halogranum amylolyticum]|uniref:4-aminobutyrate aminotransferase / (S)-3-amino-2-methylpropionate transaminase n=1 Tax=Halogranum amylolyticum TaxID=660520 RepID=A0A1H8V0H7_9EURY|nr:aspartate aminotransferase family protein [Halogranum amylolyticum]SEP08733.1 4-aminobutyrate aminotransferase / (S)-3-amino-2-methylpropionate transaminase [Halogranum amylolyticum]
MSGHQSDEEQSNASTIDQYDEYVMPVWKSLHVPIKRASGCLLEDFEGNEYLDLFSGISVTNVGHGNTAVVEAAKSQLDEFTHGCSYVHPNQPVADLAREIADVAPGDLQKTFFCNSGTEAVEGAIKLARKYTGSKEVVALEMGFHGRTLGSLALTGNKAYKSGMAPTINDVAHAPPPYAYRCPRCDSERCDAACAEQLERTIGTHTSDDLAAVVLEPVMGEAGIVVPSAEWLQRVSAITHEHDALLVVDEVQTGYGRTGRMFASEQFDLEPDILTQAKGIANGLPLGAVTASEEVANTFDPGDHFSTFGGNPVSCAAALATIDELRGGVVDDAHERGVWLETELKALEDEHEVVGEVRGLGLMWGIELVEPGTTGPQHVAPRPDSELARAVSAHLRADSNVVIGVGGYYNNVLRFQPPLSISQEQVEHAVEQIDTALDATV